MDYALALGVTYAQLGDQPIFLNRIRNRYFGLKPHLADGFLALAKGDRDIPVQIIETLLRRGIIAPGPSDEDLLPFSWRPLRSSLLEMETRGAATPGGIAATGLAMARARRSLKSLPLSDNLRRLAERKARLPIRDADQLGAASAEFIACRRYIPLRPVCLLDSIGLLEFLAARQCAADLVVGVGVKPFAAHCWIQQDHQALNETLLRVAGLAPITAV